MLRILISVVVTCLVLWSLPSNASGLDISNQGALNRFVQSLPGDAQMAQEMQQAMASCDCRLRSPEMSLALVRYLSDTFSRSGYDYNAVMASYAVHAKEAFVGGNMQLQSRLQRYGLNDLAMPLVSAIQEGLDDTLVNQGLVTRQTVQLLRDIGI